jgi:hypothetical protein
MGITLSRCGHTTSEIYRSRGAVEFCCLPDADSKIIGRVGGVCDPRNDTTEPLLHSQCAALMGIVIASYEDTH